MTVSPPTRRFFLKRLAAATAAFTLLSTGFVLETRAGRSRRRLEELDPEDWRRLRGHRFRYAGDDGEALDLRLVEVRDRSHLTRDAHIRQFSLIFDTDREQCVPQGTGRLLHEAVEGPSVLLVPVVRSQPAGRSGPAYEVAFSRFTNHTRLPR